MTIDEKLTPYRDKIEAMRRAGRSWKAIGYETGVKPENIRTWCAGWMDADLLKPVNAMSRYAQEHQVKAPKKPQKGDAGFAAAMAGRRFSSMKLTPDRRMTMQAPSGYVPREANS